MSEQVERLDEHPVRREERLDVGLFLVRHAEVVVIASLDVVLETVGEQHYGVQRLLHHHDLGRDRQLPDSWTKETTQGN